MEWLVILMLVLIGVTLVILEFLVFPGINVAGVLGFVCLVAGVYLGYTFFGVPVGHFILLGTAVFAINITLFALRSKTWKRLSLDSKIDSVVEGVDLSVKEGDCGETVGRLAPMGNVRIGDVLVEAESQDGYIDPQQHVVVVKVFKNKIIVKLKTV